MIPDSAHTHTHTPKPRRFRHPHVVAADDVEAEGHLLHAGGRGEDPLVAVLQDDVGRLVEALEHALFCDRDCGDVVMW